MTIYRDLSTKENREYWRRMDETAAEAEQHRKRFPALDAPLSSSPREPQKDETVKVEPEEPQSVREERERFAALIARAREPREPHAALLSVDTLTTEELRRKVQARMSCDSLEAFALVQSLIERAADDAVRSTRRSVRGEPHAALLKEKGSEMTNEEYAANRRLEDVRALVTTPPERKVVHLKPGARVEHQGFVATCPLCIEALDALLPPAALQGSAPGTGEG